MAEKWEMSAANTELKNRLQQSMAMSHMQGNNGNMLEEELHKMQVALAEERKVTEKLSRNLELEKRRVESLEQKAKGAHRFDQLGLKIILRIRNLLHVVRVPLLCK